MSMILHTGKNVSLSQTSCQFVPSCSLALLACQACCMPQRLLLHSTICITLCHDCLKYRTEKTVMGPIQRNEKHHRLLRACVSDADLKCNCTGPTMLHNYCKRNLTAFRALAMCILVVLVSALAGKAVLLAHSLALQLYTAQVVCRASACSSRMPSTGRLSASTAR